MQALDRTQPGRPLRPGRQRTLPHDDKRHGATTFFSGIAHPDGQVIGTCLPRHGQPEFLCFLVQSEAESPREPALHLIVDSNATHQHPNVSAWLKRRPRVPFPCPATSVSWLNRVERFFRDFTPSPLRADIFQSVAELETAIGDYLRHRHTQSRPFSWTAQAFDLLADVTPAKAALVTSQHRRRTKPT